MTARGRANPLALAVLCTLYERPMHPYEVAQTLRTRGKHTSVRLNYGSLYGVVEALEKRGFITPIETLREGKRPERTVYELTNTGRREVVDWLSDLLGTPAKEYLQFEAALTFLPVLSPAEALPLLTGRCTALEIELAQMRAAKASAEAMGLPRLFELEAEYKERLHEAELDWLRLLVKDIESGSLEGQDMWVGFHDPPPDPPA